MRRKINRVGQNTLTVSLPSKWAKKHNLKAGAEVDVTEQGSVLSIHAHDGLTPEELRVKISRTTESHLRSIIGNAYKRGHDKIILQFDDPAVLKDVQRIVDTLLGIEIISMSKSECEIRNISREMDTEFDHIMKRSFIMVLEMASEVYADVDKKRYERLDDIIYKKSVIAKHIDFCKRILNKHKRNEAGMLFTYLIIWSLEKIANEYLYIYRYCNKQGVKKFSKPLLDFFVQANALLQLYYQSYYEHNLAKIEKLAKTKDHLLFTELHLMRKKITPDDMPVLHHLASIVRRLWDMSGPLHGLYLE